MDRARAGAEILAIAPARADRPGRRSAVARRPFASRMPMKDLPHRIRRGTLALLAAAATAAASAQGATGVPQQLATTTLRAGMYNIVAQVARTPSEREKGLMFRTQMAAHEGMLFVFEEPQPQCFWMRNTLLPLSIAFIADDGTIVNVEEMAPQTEATHCSAKPVRYALEMNKAWFSKRGLAAGTKLAGGPFSR